jgi:hypothetical protein
MPAVVADGRDRWPLWAAGRIPAGGRRHLQRHVAVNDGRSREEVGAPLFQSSWQTTAPQLGETGNGSSCLPRTESGENYLLERHVAVVIAHLTNSVHRLQY